jgi:hypothetical protein
MKSDENFKKTKAGVFIIESLEFEDEASPTEGQILQGILQMSGMPCEYFYVRSQVEFEHFIDVFADSDYRFLHISCHGNQNSIALTLGNITHEELGFILEDKLIGRRLFMSACAAVNSRLSKHLFPKSGCNSLVGPNESIGMKDVAIFWASFYHLMFKANNKAMKKNDLIANLDVLAKLYEIPVKYFKKSTKKPFFSEEKLMYGSPKPNTTDIEIE